MSVYFDPTVKQWRWEFNRKIAGKRVRLTKVLPKGWDRAKAEKYDRLRTEEIYAVANGVKKPDLSLAGAVALYLDHRVPQLEDGKNIARELGALYDYIEKAKLEDVGNVARKYAADEASKLQPGTIRNRLAYLRAAVRYAYRRHNYGDRNYSDQILLPSVKNERQVYLRPAEVTKLLSKIEDKESRAVFTLAYYTGFRWIKEVLPRTERDVTRRKGVYWLTAGKTKNGTPRMKPIHPHAVWALKHMPFKLHWRTYFKKFDRARRELGLRHVNPHDLRHSLASEIISQGGTLADVQGALHHDSVVSSRRYAHLYPERLADVLLGVGQKTPPRKGGKAAKST